MTQINKKYTCHALVVLALLAPLFSGCSEEPATAAATAPPPPAVSVSSPLEKTVTEFAEFTGTTEAVESVTIRARVEGVLEKRCFTPGEIVNKGDLLYTIDAKPYTARLEEAKAERLIHEAELRLAKATLQRRENAFKEKAVSEVEVIEAHAAFSTAKAAVASARASIKIAEINLSYTKITAPITGKIGRSLVDPGNLVGAGERTELTTIVNDREIYAYFTISERDLLFYKKPDGGHSPANDKTPVLLGLSNQTGYPFKGQIDYIHNRVNQLNGTIGIRALFQNKDAKLMPGLFARVKIPVGNRKDALLVPNTALGRDQQGYFLLIADKDNRVRHQPVEAGILINGMRVIVNGITKNDRVIINGLQKAHPGGLVTPVNKRLSAENFKKSDAERS